ncbi:MAG: gliding motility-associated C-terminal domain-containing protein, partial [Bacteroidales bacterium]|nr:gliding motility-associated C-terminal domain-containing protein [Bacteroidales bacterium]
NSSGYFTVLLKIEDEFGCRDSIEHEVLVLESIEFPNLFTPVGLDGKKYVFRPLEEKGYFKEFQIDIYNRWGNPVWKNTCAAPNCPDYADSFWWDGYNKQGKLVEDGVYYWVVRAVPLSGTKPVIKNGSVTVIHRK